MTAVPDPGVENDPARDARPATSPRLISGPFVSLAVAALAFYIAGGVILPVTPGFVESRLGGGQFEIGVVVGSYALASLLLRPLVGWSSDRFGRRPLLIGGAVLTLAGMLVHLVAVNATILVLARSLLGGGEAFFLVAALAAASDLAPPSRRGEALSFLSLSLYLGVAIGPLIGEVVLDRSSYETVWLVTAAIAAVAVVLSLLVPETAPAALDHSKRVRPPLIHPAGLFPGFIVLAGMWGMAGFFTFLPGHARAVGLGGASVPLVVYAVVVIVLRIVGARVPDRYGSGRVGAVALALSAIGLIVIGIAPGSAGLLIGTAIFASGIAFTMPALISLAVSRVPPEERGTVVGTTAVFLDVAFGIAPVVLGGVAVTTGAAATFVISGVIAAVGSVILVARRPAVQEAAAA